MKILVDGGHKNGHNRKKGIFGDSQPFEKFGSSGRTRTYNPSVNSRMLYH